MSGIYKANQVIAKHLKVTIFNYYFLAKNYWKLATCLQLLVILFSEIRADSDEAFFIAVLKGYHHHYGRHAKIVVSHD